MSETTLPLTTTTQAVAAPRSRLARISLTALQVVLGLFYAFASALPKLIAHPSATESFDKLGWGHTGMYTIGTLELAGGLALLIPLLDSVAAVALSALMAGAFIVNVTVIHGPYVATPLILILPLALVAWARRGHTTELLHLVRRRVGRQV
ncbi:DoxX family protein [Streptomyces rhizosphaerihabitans]|uniref:DoxX family protein n=1 Tax=Streptomyces rhizosphaerihabitans TaxID=1266770 RepID=UPI0021C2447D|nr:DoxX family protein [Streptomyces rhizosphaerihabitans]MCT9005030.1 DoxX family protein [Streptomyces rhizosphaerihabitans]